eukprot:CAMPEP_0172444314 /NCGR_PEP_ID=MMETSP1065-20121228/4375_1 /TAXON_ID=265537 /ORGANISM="Amphiprora paludosa, Strain CCMP125" /LENGTH=60 /DNA_ID=CAMNT_0013194797 /DNA_START=673 /DNA_END=852 /DNA_ORIENTATION=+
MAEVEKERLSLVWPLRHSISCIRRPSKSVWQGHFQIFLVNKMVSEAVKGVRGVLCPLSPV